MSKLKICFIIIKLLLRILMNIFFLNIRIINKKKRKIKLKESFFLSNTMW